MRITEDLSPHQCKDALDNELRHGNLASGHADSQFGELLERTVQHQCLNTLWPVLQLVQEDRRGSHRTTPEDKLLYVEMVSKELEHRLDVILLQVPTAISDYDVPKGNVLPLWVSSTLEIETTKVCTDFGCMTGIFDSLYQASIEPMAVHYRFIT